jgi:hypothetical protein
MIVTEGPNWGLYAETDLSFVAVFVPVFTPINGFLGVD